MNGIKVLVDWSGITLHHLITLYKVENVKKVVKFLEVWLISVLNLVNFLLKNPTSKCTNNHSFLSFAIRTI